MFLAEETHFLLGLLFPFGAEALFHAPYVGAGVILVLGTVKEFTWDLKVEGATWRVGIQDLAFYVAGVIVALLLLAVVKGNL